MIPKEKALELKEKFDGYLCYAETAVDEILYVLNELDDTLSHNMTIFYNEVKEEIEKYER
jgi:hypothetical protein